MKIMSKLYGFLLGILNLGLNLINVVFCTFCCVFSLKLSKQEEICLNRNRILSVIESKNLNLNLKMNNFLELFTFDYYTL